MLERELIAIVIAMPLAKLQRFGDGRTVSEDRFIYRFGWRDEVSAGTVWRAGFDDTLELAPGVGDWLVRLSPLLRPLVEAKWTELVARRNADVVDAGQLNEFLFGATRISLDALREPLAALQSSRCFYCEQRLDRSVDIDHFLPWSRHPDNTLDNLVATHRRCNSAKSASIAAHGHLDAWVERLGDERLGAAVPAWPRRPERTLGAITAAYLWLPEGARLWVEGQTYETVDPAHVRRALGRGVALTARPLGADAVAPTP